MNLNKRTVELDLKSAAGKAKLRELIMEADVITANLLAGSMDKLGFGYKDVLEIIKGRGKGIVYAETVGFLLLVEPICHLSGANVDFETHRTHSASLANSLPSPASKTSAK